MRNELENKAVNTHEADTVEVRKKWKAPQLTAVSIAELTENGIAAGNDGVPTSSLS